MWCDGFDADLLKVVPGAAAVLGDTAGVPLLTYSRLTGGKINHPSVWNGAGALFWTGPAYRPPAFYHTDVPVARCTFLEAVRDMWVHSCTVVVNEQPVWQPPVRLMERLMYDVRGWAPLDAGERETTRKRVQAGLAAAAQRFHRVIAGE